jgi:cell division protein FtsQ
MKRAAPSTMQDIRVRSKAARSMGGPRQTESVLFRLPRIEKKHFILAAFLLFGLTSAIGLRQAGLWIAGRPMFDIHQVRVVGDLDQVDRDLIRKRVLALKGSFFNIDLSTASSELRTVPWVRSVTLRRIWPDQLEIGVEEHHPLGRWGDSELINTKGERFTAEYSGVLPYFEGPKGSESLMHDEFQQFHKQLKQLALSITDLELTERGSWRLIADNGLEIELGKDDVHGRLARFIEIYPQLVHNAALSGAVADLRYSHGFALRPVSASKDLKS